MMALSSSDNESCEASKVVNTARTEAGVVRSIGRYLTTSRAVGRCNALYSGSHSPIDQ